MGIFYPARMRLANTTPPQTRSPRWLLDTAFWPALAGAIVLWAAFPPLNVPALAWVAPIFWLILVRPERLPGRRPYLAIWAAALVHWMLMLNGIRLAHWLNNFGWVALSAYLALYLPAFVALTRVAVHRWRLSIVVAAPVVWTGLEFARAHLLTGFSLGSLAHTQVEWTSLIQMSDLAGAYGLGFLIMFCAACLARIPPIGGRHWQWWPLAPLAGALLLALAYGDYRTSEYQRMLADRHADGVARSLHVALLQEVVDTRFEFNPDRNVETFQLYWQAALDAREQYPELDVIIWPEGVYTANLPELRGTSQAQLPDDAGMTLDEFSQRFNEQIAAFDQKSRRVAESVNRLWRDGRLEELDVHLLIGTETWEFGPHEMRQFNSALLLDPSGEVTDRYFKMHPVMFGEYLPFGDIFPVIYRYAPMARGLTRGKQGMSFQVGDLRLAPSICFESSVPHLIRKQVVELRANGQPPDALVNLTHDGWFFGTSILDLQFVGAVFRAVELRRPVLVAANAGISCYVAGDGTIVARGPRRDSALLIVEVVPDGRISTYEWVGDWPSSICLAFSVALAVAGIGRRWWPRRQRVPSTDDQVKDTE